MSIILTSPFAQTRGEFNGPIWLSFERLTCVPIQTRMVKDSMLTKEERAWIKVRLIACVIPLEYLFVYRLTGSQCRMLQETEAFPAE